MVEVVVVVEIRWVEVVLVVEEEEEVAEEVGWVVGCEGVIRTEVVEVEVERRWWRWKLNGGGRGCM